MCPGRLVLGPILFITLSNGLENCVECMLIKLKDNKTLYRTGNTLKTGLKLIMSLIN